MTHLIPNLEWYRTISQEHGVQPRCPFATVEQCPRYYQSLSLLGKAGYTSIQADEDERLKKHWEATDIWPRTDEQATSVLSSNDRPFQYSNFCPEVSFESFGYFGTSLGRYVDEYESYRAHQHLSAEDVPDEDWRWRWEYLFELHYTDCPLYSILVHRDSKQPSGSLRSKKESLSISKNDKNTKEDIIDLKPNFFGLGINLNALARKCKSIFSKKEKT